MGYSARPEFKGLPDRVSIELLDAYIEKQTARLADLARILAEVDLMRTNQKKFFQYKLEKYKMQSIRHEKRIDEELAKLKREKFIPDPEEPGKQRDIFG